MGRRTQSNRVSKQEALWGVAFDNLLSTRDWLYFRLVPNQAGPVRGGHEEAFYIAFELY